MFKGIEKFFHVVISFVRDHADVLVNVCLVLLFTAFLISLVVLVSCRGTWSLENHSKVNGVKVDTYLNYSDGSSGEVVSSEPDDPSSSCED